MKKNTILPFLAVVFMLGINSCQETPKTQKLKKVSIESASSLMITSDGANGKALYKTSTTNNKVEKVTYLDEAGAPLTKSMVPSNIFDVNNDYLILCFNYDNEAHLVRKLDGATFDLTPLGVPHYIVNNGQWEGPDNRPRVQTDAAGNIYYIKGYQAPLVKVDVSNPNSLTGAVFTLSDDEITNFAVTPEGNVAYKSWGTNTGDRVKKVAGGTHVLPNGNFWIDLSDKINYTVDAGANGYHVVQLDINSTTGNVNVDTFITITDNIFIEGSGDVYELRFSDKIILVNSAIMEIDNATHTPTTISYVTGNLEKAEASTNYFYLLIKDGANRVLKKVHKDTYQEQILLSTTPGGYDVFDFSVNDNNVTTFYAIRLSDSAKVVGEIDANGIVTIQSSAISNPVIQLQRIN